MTPVSLTTSGTRGVTTAISVTCRNRHDHLSRGVAVQRYCYNMSHSTRLPVFIRHLLRRQRGSMAAPALIVLTLALALGANTAVFSVADALLARAVPFREPGQLVAVTSAYPNIRLAGMGLSGPEALELQSLTTVFAFVGPDAFSAVTVQGSTAAEQANTVEISQGARDALDTVPLAGRPFADSDFLKGGAPVVMLGHAFWTRLWRRPFNRGPDGENWPYGAGSNRYPPSRRHAAQSLRRHLASARPHRRRCRCAR